MPRKLRVNKAKQQLTDMQYDFLCGRPLPERNFEAYVLEYNKNGTNEKLWSLHRDTILIEHVKLNPGTRPPLWWEFDAPRLPIGTFPGWFIDGKLPMPRERIGGTGTPAYLVTSVGPSFWIGLPDAWVGINQDDPPVFESQAAFLKRNEFLFAGEEKRADFEPEIVSTRNFL